MQKLYLISDYKSTLYYYNDVWALGLGGRFKLSNRISLNLEYYYVLSKQTAKDFHDSFTIGFDIETWVMFSSYLFTAPKRRHPPWL